jgi:hypothetical protein
MIGYGQPEHSEEERVEWALLAVVLLAWLIGMWTILRMILAAWNAGQRWFGLISPSIVSADYNHKNFRRFACCVAVAVAGVFALNVLWWTGLIKPSLF